MSLVGELIEIILYVQNMDAMTRLYRDTLGLAITFPQNKNNFSSESWVTLAAGACTLALHSGGKEPRGATPTKIVFRVNDIYAARTELLNRGVKIGEVRPAAPGVWVCDAWDVEGNPFSIESHEE